ncbi:MAG: Ion channel, partial [Pseudomonadota bacterium]
MLNKNFFAERFQRTTLRLYNVKLRPFQLFFIYISLIVIYAFVYYCIPDAVNTPDFTLIKSLYFSTVTITTLGYGDITPKSNCAMIIV